MTVWFPLSLNILQYQDSNNVAYSGAVLKPYAAGTTTPISFAVDSAGTTTVSSVALNASGFPEVGGNVVVLFMDRDFKMSLYPDQASADSNTGAIWTVDNLGKVSDETIATGGTELISNADRFGQKITVIDFGAKRDGVTDDTTAFENAASSGLPVFVPSGNYVISQDVTGDFYSDGVVNITGGIVNKIINRLEQSKVLMSNQPLFSGSARYLGLKDAFYTVVDSGLFTYKAFPFFFVSNNPNLHAIAHSSGAGHANSDEIIYSIIDRDTNKITQGVFFDLNTLVYSTGWLEDYLPNEGDYANFRSVYTVVRENGVLNTYTTSSINEQDDTYVIWGQPFQYNGDWYTGAYRTVGGYPRSAMVKSTDNMKTWTFFALVASVSSREYSEVAFLNTVNQNFLAIVREDLISTRDMAATTSTDGGVTWADVGTILPVIPNVKGTQPFLMKLSNGNIMLLVGKRTTSSGVDSGGALLNNEDITGVAYHISTDNGVTWSDAVQLAPSWSTDCGNPAAKELPNGNVAVAFYTALGATNGNVGVEPSVIYLEFDPVNTKFS